MELAYGADPAQLARLLVAACELDEERRRARSAEEREEELALVSLLPAVADELWRIEALMADPGLPVKLDKNGRQRDLAVDLVRDETRSGSAHTPLDRRSGADRTRESEEVTSISRLVSALASDSDMPLFFSSLKHRELGGPRR